MKSGLKLPTDGDGHVICMGDLGWFVLATISPEGCTETHKSSFCSYKQVSETSLIKPLSLKHFTEIPLGDESIKTLQIALYEQIYNAGNDSRQNPNSK